MNKGNLASLFLSLLLIVGLSLALMPTSAKALKYIPSDTSFGDWNSIKRIYTLGQDVAEAVVLLVSDRAKFITGQVLEVKGGCLMD
jgi:NAD(P)-dependent dehydrogenase (short-subunit alcohol dehydrogenase family)